MLQLIKGEAYEIMDCYRMMTHKCEFVDRVKRISKPDTTMGYGDKYVFVFKKLDGYGAGRYCLTKPEIKIKQNNLDIQFVSYEWSDSIEEFGSVVTTKYILEE